MLKRCTACGDEKPLDQFHADASRPDGRVSQCVDCRRILRRMSYERCKPKQLAYQRAVRAKIFADPTLKREYYLDKSIKRKMLRDRQNNPDNQVATIELIKILVNL